MSMRFGISSIDSTCPRFVRCRKLDWTLAAIGSLPPLSVRNRGRHEGPSGAHQCAAATEQTLVRRRSAHGITFATHARDPGGLELDLFLGCRQGGPT